MERKKNIFFKRWLWSWSICVFCWFPQGEVRLSKRNADLTDRARDVRQGPSPHRSYQTAQQQVGLPPRAVCTCWYCWISYLPVCPWLVLIRILLSGPSAGAPGRRWLKKSLWSITLMSRTKMSPPLPIKRRNLRIYSGIIPLQMSESCYFTFCSSNISEDSRGFIIKSLSWGGTTCFICEEKLIWIKVDRALHASFWKAPECFVCMRQ